MKKLILIIGVLLCVATLENCKTSQKNEVSEVLETAEDTAEESNVVTIGEEASEDSADLIDDAKETLPLLTYERTYCFGTCPVFKSTILQSGKVNYEGINFVNNMGNHHSEIKQADLDSIASTLKRINYFQMDSVYDNPGLMDVPSVITSACVGSESNAVLDRYKSPKELRELYKLVDSIYAELEWKATDNNE